MTVTPMRNMPEAVVPDSAKRSGGAHGLKHPIGSAATGPSYTVFSNIKMLFNSYAPLGYLMPWEILDYVELLSTFNPDYSQAVDNIRTLANSGHELFITADSTLQVARTRSYLEDLARTVQERHGGMDGLVDKLLDQAATYGAMCGEWLLDSDTLEVVDFADINPKHIRFFWDVDLYRYVPYQKVSAAQAQQAKERGQEVIDGHIRLNEVTFHYYAFDAAPNSPYGTPPFVAALNSIGIQGDMIANMAQIVKKVGLLGIIDIVVQQLPPKPGESDADYQSRAEAYLAAYVEAGEQMVRDGGLVHFDDVEVKTTSLTGNAAGATNIFKQNEELIFSGLKSMPSVQGRSYSTTETYAGVAYDIIIRNTKKYQRAVKRMIESGYWLACNLKGLRPSGISITFNENKTLHRLQSAQSEQLEIRNAALKWKAGIFNQLMFAQELGYSDVVTPVEEPPAELLTGKSSDPNTGNNDAQGSGALDSTGGGKADNQNNN